MLGTPVGFALAELAQSRPLAPALTFDPRRPRAESRRQFCTLTRRELDRRTNRLARAYAGLGVAPGSFVTICLPTGIEFVEAVIAAWKLGAIPQPISARLPAHERIALIKLSQPALVVGVPAHETADFPALPADFEPSEHISAALLPPRTSPHWKALASRGGSGEPTLIIDSQPASLEALLPLAALLRMRGGGAHLVTGPLHRNVPFVTSLCALLAGNHVVLSDVPLAPETVLSLVPRHQIDWLYLAPTMMRRIWSLPERQRSRWDLSCLGTMAHMGGPCPPWLKQAWIDWIGAERIFELYGSAEGQALTAITGQEWLAHRGSVGRPVLGEIEIVGSQGVLATVSADSPPRRPSGVGEVWVRRGQGAPAAYRYIGTSPRRRPGGWEFLGDRGRIDEDGYLYLEEPATAAKWVGASGT